MKWRMAKAIILLPGNALIVIPAIVYWLSRESGYEGQVPDMGHWTLWLAILVGAPSLALMGKSAHLFITLGGGGTPAPWDPIEHLLIVGPYRYVRNPMLIGVILFLVAEALLFRSYALGAWALVFFMANFLYFPLVEEKGLISRYGDAYLEYMRHVPRWLPRRTPYDP